MCLLGNEHDQPRLLLFVFRSIMIYYVFICRYVSVCVHMRVSCGIWARAYHQHLVFMKYEYEMDYFQLDMTLITSVSYHLKLYFFRKFRQWGQLHLHMPFFVKKNLFWKFVIDCEIKGYYQVLRAVITYGGEVFFICFLIQGFTFFNLSIFL